MTNLTNLKRITDEDTARKILAMINEDLNPCEVSEATDRWAEACYHYPPYHELVMSAADDLLGTCGVESEPTEDFEPWPPVYCNTGDSYDATLYYIDGRYVVTSYATRHGG